MQNKTEKKKKLSLTTWIFVALLAGALTGVVINYVIPPNYVVDDILVSGVFYVVGQGFIRLMRMLVVPLVPSYVEAWRSETRRSSEMSA